MLIGSRRKKVQKLTRDFLLATLGSIGPVHYVQVGANDGRLADPVFKTARRRRWSGLLIEPNPLYFGRLSHLHRNNDRIKLVNCGVSETEGEMQLFHLLAEAEPRYPSWAPGCASLDRERLLEILSPHSENAPDDITGTPVLLRRLDNILAEHKISSTDLLVIDVEGHELNVLQSFDLASVAPKMMIVEQNRGEDGPIRKLMKDAGYAVHRIGDDLIALRPDFPSPAIGSVISLIGFPAVES